LIPQLEDAIGKNDGRLQVIFKLTLHLPKWLEFHDAYLDLYDTWVLHRQRIDNGSTSFWVDSFVDSENRLWKHERFGNYIYGCILSTFFTYSDLSEMLPHREKDVFLKPMVVSRFTQDLCAGLDCFACVEALVADRVPKYDELKHVYFGGKSGYADTPYVEAGSFISDPNFEFLKCLRNLLTHRPFWQFMIDQNGNHYLPQDPDVLDSITQRSKSYMPIPLQDFGHGVFDKTITMLTSSFRRVDKEYRSKIAL